MDHDSERPHPPLPFIDCCASCSANQTPVFQNVPPSLGTKPFFNQNTAFSPLSRVLKCFLSSQNGYFPTLSSSMKKTNYFLFIFSCVRWWHCRVPRNTYPLEQDVSCERYNVSYRNFTVYTRGWENMVESTYQVTVIWLCNQKGNSWVANVDRHVFQDILVLKIVLIFEFPLCNSAPWVVQPYREGGKDEINKYISGIWLVTIRHIPSSVIFVCLSGAKVKAVTEHLWRILK